MKKVLIALTTVALLGLLVMPAMGGYYNKNVVATITVDVAIDFWTADETIALVYDEGGSVAYDDNGVARTGVTYTSNHAFQASIYLDTGGDIPEGTRLAVLVDKGNWPSSEAFWLGQSGVAIWHRLADGTYTEARGAGGAVAMFDAGPNPNMLSKTVDIAILGFDAMAPIGTYSVDLVWVVSTI